jgi:DNA-3-methyladenine glycosylase
MNTFTPLPRKFYEPTAKAVAPALLGHFLIRRTAGGCCGGMIVEVEAYLTGDPAAHSFVGPTSRNLVMFGPPGHGYVYFIYGNHYCFNAVCRPPGTAEAVLVRAIEPVFGLESLQARRAAGNLANLTNGPGKLCAAMDIGRALDGADLCDPGSPVIIARNPARRWFLAAHGPLVTTTRIGITKAASLPLRFYLGGSAYVSRRRPLPGIR